MHNRCRLFAAGLWLAGLALSTPVAAGATRRALLVGIDSYSPPASGREGPVKARRGAFPRIAVLGESRREPFDSLDGAVSDMEGMKALLTDKYGFRQADVRTLTNEQATADAILGAIEQHLIDAAQPGDVGVFYYAGHGSLMRNLKTPERSGFDSTIVPADWWRGTPDIRDKELARLFRKAVAKGIVLTVIADSCHSGSLLRGSLRLREVPGDAGFYVEDPPDRDAAGQTLPNPEDEGALVLSAAQDDQCAAEVATDSGWHGVFTWALIQVLRYSPENEPVSRVFERVRALVQSEEPVQEPVMAGKGRAERALFGQPADLTRRIAVAARKVTGPAVELQGGQVLGLAKGCELVKAPGTAGEAPVRIEITEVAGPSRSLARVLSGPPESVRPGDLFELDRWVQPEEGILRVYLPPTPPPLARVMAVAETMAGPRLPGWVDDPTVAPPDIVMSWAGSEWVLSRNRPGGEVLLRLGTDPDPARVRQKLAETPSARFFLALPLPAEAAGRVRLGPGAALDAIVPVTSGGSARYVLEGRYREGKLEFAWVAPAGSEEELRRAAAVPRMPLRTRWLALAAGAGSVAEVAAEVESYALRLARLRAWMEIEPPAADVPFPYGLAFKEVSSGRLITGGEMRKGERYKLYLRADPDLLRRLEQSGQKAPPRYVYVFIIDSDGAGTSLFPGAQGNVENRFPSGTAPLPAEIPLSSRDYDLEVSDPLGTDVYFLIASPEAIDPTVLSFEGVRGGGLSTGGGGLSRLLFGLGSGQKRGAATPPAPPQWSIERRVMQSVAK